MAETITTALALPVTFATTASIIVTDSGAGSPRTATFPASTYRQFLAYVGGSPAGVNTGTEADPHEWGKYFQYKLNNNGALALWSVAMGTDGRWVVTYSGTGTGQVEWDELAGTSKVPRVMTGFGANLSIAAGGSSTATHQPFAFAATIGRGEDTGLASLPAKTVGAEMPDGSVYAWTDNQHRVMRTFNLEFQPKNLAQKNALGAAGTPLFPTALTVMKAPSLVPTSSYVLPWSVYETIRTAAGKRLGYTTNFQALVAGSSFAFDDGYLSLETINAQVPNKPQAPGYDARWKWTGVQVVHYAEMSR